MQTLVFDASSLILLAKIDLLKLIAQQVKIVIPAEIQKEATVKEDLFDAQYIQHLIHEQMIHVTSTIRKTLVTKLEADFKLGTGESSCITLGLEHHWIVVTEDIRAIKTCKVLGIPFTSALNLLVHYYDKKLLTKEMALAKLEKLKEYGWYSSILLERVAKTIKEGD